MGVRSLPSITTLASTVLRTQEGADVLASTLWQTQPVAVLILRRPGCVLCRDEAQRLWSLKPEFDRLGVGLACVVHEWIPREINAFSPNFWPGPLFHDPSKAFYSALNGGAGPLRGNLWAMLNPWGEVWKRIRAASQNVKEHNVVGDGLTMGGAMVIQRAAAAAGGNSGGDAGGDGSMGGRVAWMHVEREIGLVADPHAMLAAAREVVAGARAGSAAKSAKGV